VNIKKKYIHRVPETEIEIYKNETDSVSLMVEYLPSVRETG